MVHVLDIDTASPGAFLHHEREQIHRWHGALADAVVSFVLRVQALELILIGKKGIVQTGHIMRREQGNVLAFNQALVHQAVNLHAIIQVAHTVFFHTTVVFQHQQ